MNPDNMTFEQAYERLVEIVGQLESGEMALEASVTLYEEGQRLARLCIDLLDSAELRVQQLSEDGTLGPLDG